MIMPTVPPVIQGSMVFPSLAIQNTMACRVFRLLKLGLIERPVEFSSNSVDEWRFRSPYSMVPRRFFRTQEGESYSDVIVLSPLPLSDERV